MVLLLDCCYAAQAARANQSRAIPGNVELLAACAMGRKSPPPGPGSFTSHLIKQLRVSLTDMGSAKISDIALSLAERNDGFRETPIYFSGLGDGKSTICLEPFNVNPASDLDVIREAAWLTLRVSLRDILSEGLISDIVKWLKARPSRKVAKLTVEKVVQSTNNMHQFIQGEGRAAASAPRFEQLPTSAKDEVLMAWSNVKSLLAALATQLKSQDFKKGLETQTQEIGSGQVDAALRGPPAALLELENGLLSLQGVVQRNVMALPDLNSKRDLLLEAIEDTVMQDMGFIPLLNRRLKALFPSDSVDSLKIDHSIIEAPNGGPKSFQSLVPEVLEDLGSILVEYKTYETRATKGSDKDKVETRILQQRVQTLADILQTPGTPDFHTLRCRRWFHQPDDTRFGLVFEYPERCNKFMSLRDLLNSPASRSRPTLAQRYSIVGTVGEALLKWHISANWVHGGIASHNIYFFKPTDSPNYDYSKPYLCGFEFSRPSDGISFSPYVENFEQNVYRHPSRQGPPTEYQKKRHDLYSYGILLLEVGMWKLVRHFFDATQKDDLAPKDMEDIIKANASQRLGHYMGAAYERATSRCLNMEFGVKLDDSLGSQLSKAFENLVLKGIEPGTRLD